MAFQGFAREEQFSTNQIKIDIGSVIENDLAEANRQSKYMAKNSAMGEKWRGMYLNAMINKHEAEKRNREDNWNFFMDNRAEIQKQVEYNNSVKAKDAERSHPYIPSLGDILGPALMKMAVDVGGVAIKKHFTDQKKRKEEAKAQEVKANTGEMVDYHARINDSVRNYLRSGALDNLRNDVTNKEKLLNLAEQLHERDPTISVEEHSIYLRARAGLTQVDAQAVANSPQNISNLLTEFSANHVMPYNGIEVTEAMVLSGGVNRELGKLWKKSMADGFRDTYNIDNLLPETRGSVAGTIRKFEGQFSQLENNNRRKKAIKDLRTNTAQRFESLADGPDGFNEQVNYMLALDGGGPAQIKGSRNAGFEALEDFARAGSWSLSDIDKFMGGVEGNNYRNLFTEKSERGETWRQIRSEALREQYQSLNDYNMQKTMLGRQLEVRMSDPNFDPQEASAILEAVSAGSGVNNKMKTFLSEIPTETRNNIIAMATVLSRKREAVQVESPSYAAVSKAYTSGNVADIIQQMTHEAAEGLENEKAVATLLKDETHRAVPAVRNWLAGLKDEYDPHDEMSKNQFKSLVSKKLGDKVDTDRQELVRALTPKTFELKPEGGKKYYKKAKWNGLNLLLKDNIPKASGVSELTSIISASNGVLNINEVTSNEVIIEAISGYMGNLDKAQKAGRDISELVANPPAVLTLFGQRLKDGHSSQAINYMIRDHFDHMKPLSGNNLFTPEEVQKMNQRVTGWSNMGRQAGTYFLQAQGVPGGGITPKYQTPASSYTSGPVNVPQTNGEVYEVGYSAGGGLGGTSTLNPANEYHLDIKFDKSMPMQQVVEQFDKMAYAYMKTNQEIAFSNQGVSGIKYNPADSYTNKIKLLTNVFGAHSHSMTPNMNSGDFYVVPKGGTAWDSGAENAKVVAPSLPGGSIDSQISTGYGGSVNIRDRAGKVVMTLGHLNKDIMGGN